jgi:hypothetical protein
MWMMVSMPLSERRSCVRAILVLSPCFGSTKENIPDSEQRPTVITHLSANLEASSNFPRNTKQPSSTASKPAGDDAVDFNPSLKREGPRSRAAIYSLSDNSEHRRTTHAPCSFSPSQWVSGQDMNLEFRCPG